MVFKIKPRPLGTSIKCGAFALELETKLVIVDEHVRMVYDPRINSNKATICQTCRRICMYVGAGFTLVIIR